MAKVIIVTNFSESSRNALDYTCALLQGSNTSVLLLNIFTFPGSLSYDGIALAAMSEIISEDEELLKSEYEWARSNYPGINIRPEMVTGAFMKELRAKALEENAALIIMGANGDFNDFFSWGVNIIDSVIDLQTPVLVIPSSVKFKPVQKIGFACDYCRKNLLMPLSMIRRITRFVNAELHVIHVSSPSQIIDEESLDRKKAIQQNLLDLSPSYYELEYENVNAAIDNFINENNIDVLIVIPSRHGIWHNFFQNGHTKGLVYLNHIPILSIHQEGEFL